MKESHYFDFCLAVFLGTPPSPKKFAKLTTTAASSPATITTITMTSSTTNRTAIAATLLGLLATITGTRAQAPPPECVCSPRVYSVSFDLAQDCATTDIRFIPGLGSISVGCRSSLLKMVTQVVITEYGPGGGIQPSIKEVRQSITGTSGTVPYTSASNDLQAGAPLEDQSISTVVPGSIRVVLEGNDQNGNPLTFPPRVSIGFTNECNGTPINFQNQGIGYLRFVSIMSIYFVSTTHYPLE